MKALSVFSGGLDSILAAELIRAQGIEVLGLFFETPFFTAGRARQSAASVNLPLNVIDITTRHLEMIKQPRHGYGENMNPCIDCHALMLRIAGERLEEEGAHFIITGEVLGQRPMSQNRRSLQIVADESGYADLILRPLSAGRLPMSIPEKEGWVDRSKLLNCSGRGRKPQMALAARLGITDYPSPAGGCLLTEVVFSRRLRDLLSTRPDCEIREIELLKHGRHFRIAPRAKLVVGRNKRDNQSIEVLTAPEDLVLDTPAVPGPTAVLLGDTSPEIEALAASITASYSDAKDHLEIEVRCSRNGKERVIQTRGRKKENFMGLMI